MPSEIEIEVSPAIYPLYYACVRDDFGPLCGSYGLFGVGAEARLRRKLARIWRRRAKRNARSYSVRIVTTPPGNARRRDA